MSTNFLDAIGPGLEGFTKGFMQSKQLSIQRAMKENQAQKTKIQMGKAFTDIFKPGQSSAVTELKLNLFARTVGVDTKSDQFKDILKFAKAASDEERKEISESITALIPDATPAQVQALVKNFASNPQVLFSLMDSIEKKSQQTRLQQAGEIASGFEVKGRGQTDEVRSETPLRGSVMDKRRQIADRRFKAAQTLRSNAKSEKDFEIADRLEDQALQILEGKQTEFDNQLIDVTDPGRPTTIAQGTTPLEKLQNRRNELSPGRDRDEVQGAIDKDTGASKLEKLLSSADRLEDRADREPDENQGDRLRQRADLIRARAKSLGQKAGFSITTNPDGTVSITRGTQPKGISPTQADKLIAQRDSIDKGLEQLARINQIFQQDPTLFGTTGGLRKGAKDFAALVEDFNVPINKIVDNALSFVGKGGLSEAQKFKLLTDPKLSKLEVLQNQLALILARTRQPTGRLLVDTLRTAMKDTKLIGGKIQGSRSVGDRLRAVFEELTESKQKLMRRIPKDNQGTGRKSISIEELQRRARGE